MKHKALYLGFSRELVAFVFSLDPKDGTDVRVDGLLICIVLVSKVEDDLAALVWVIGPNVPVGTMPDGTDNVLDMHRVDLTVAIPEQLHSLLFLLVDAAADQSWCY